MAALRSVPEVQAQQAFDEVTIEDADLKRALESRQAAKEKTSEARAAYKAANEAASGEIAKLELPVGGAVRCGRFGSLAGRSRPAASRSRRAPAIG